MPTTNSGARFKLTPERNSEDSKSQEMYTEVGRTVVQVSNIENELAALYHTLSFSYYDSTPKAMAAFYTQSRFEGKILLVDLLMRIAAAQEFVIRWEKIVKGLKQHRNLRNLVAHQGLYVSYPDKEGQVNVWLDPPELNSRYDAEKQKIVPARGRSVHLTEVRSAASALDRIRKDLSRLWSDIEEAGLPEHLRSGHVEPDEE